MDHVLRTMEYILLNIEHQLWMDRRTCFVDHRTCSVYHGTCSTCHGTYCMDHRTCSMDHSTRSITHRACSMDYGAWSTDNRTCSMSRRACPNAPHRNLCWPLNMCSIDSWLDALTVDIIAHSWNIWQVYRCELRRRRHTTLTIYTPWREYNGWPSAVPAASRH